MSPRTKQNLSTAMQKEAMTYAKYLRFAAQARLHEDWDLARLFQTAADADRTDHFAKEAEFAHLVASDSENLTSAVEEKKAAARMYGRFAAEATADRDLATAALFERMETAEDTQAKSFEIALRAQVRESAARPFPAMESRAALHSNQLRPAATGMRYQKEACEVLEH